MILSARFRVPAIFVADPLCRFGSVERIWVSIFSSPKKRSAKKPFEINPLLVQHKPFLTFLFFLKLDSRDKTLNKNTTKTHVRCKLQTMSMVKLFGHFMRKHHALSVLLVEPRVENLAGYWLDNDFGSLFFHG